MLRPQSLPILFAPDAGGGGLYSTESFLLDGVNEFAKFGTDASIQFVGTDFSGMGWYKYDDDNKFEFIMGNDINALGWGFIKNNANRMALYIGNQLVQAPFLAGTANIWTHLGFTFDFTLKEVVFYVNAVLVSSNTYTTSVAAPVHEVAMGIDPRDFVGITYTGNMDVVGLFNSKLSTSDFEEAYNSGCPTSLLNIAAASSLVSTWIFQTPDDPVGGTGNISDLKGSNDGTPVNTTAITNWSNDVACFPIYLHTWFGDADIQNNEADLDGVGDYITFPDSVGFYPQGDNFTLEAIMNFDAFPQDFPMIFSKWGSVGDRNFQFMYRNDTNALRLAYTINGTDVLGFDSSWTPTFGVEYHLAWCRDGADFRMFVDGVQIGATHDISTDIIAADNVRQMIGNYDVTTGIAATDGLLDGQINYLKMSNIALYTAPFTAPSTLAPSGGTVYMNSFEGADSSTPAENTP